MNDSKHITDVSRDLSGLVLDIIQQSVRDGLIEWSHKERETINEFLDVVEYQVRAQLDNGVLQRRIEVQWVDNRDRFTTWLWVSPFEYIEINPQELNDNAMENDQEA